MAGVALAGSIANWLAVEPYTTKIMLDRYELENAPQRDNDTIAKMYKSFSKWCVCWFDTCFSASLRAGTCTLFASTHAVILVNQSSLVLVRCRHGISSMLNLVVLVAAVSHGWWIAASVLRVSM